MQNVFKRNVKVGKQEVIDKFYEIKNRVDVLEKSTYSFSLDGEKEILMNVENRLRNESQILDYSNEFKMLVQLGENLKSKEIVNAINDFNVYFKNNVFSKKYDEISTNYVSLIKENILKILSYSKEQYVFLSEDYKGIFKEFFKVIYKCIQIELVFNNYDSEILNVVLKDNFFAYNVNLVIEEDFNEVKSSSYVGNKKVFDNLTEYIERRKILGVNPFLDKTIILDIIMAKDGDLLNALKHNLEGYSEVLSQNNLKRERIIDDIQSSQVISQLNDIKKHIINSNKKIRKNIISLVLSASLIFSVTVCSFNNSRNQNNKTLYKTETTLYIKHDDKILEPKVFTSYKELEEYDKTLKIEGKVSVSGYRDIEEYSLSDITSETIDNYLSAVPDVLGLNCISSEHVKADVGDYDGIVRTVKMVYQDLENSKSFFDQNNYDSDILFNSFCSLLWMLMFPFRYLRRIKKLLNKNKEEMKNYQDNKKQLDSLAKELNDLFNQIEKWEKLYKNYENLGILDIVNSNLQENLKWSLKEIMDSEEEIKKLRLEISKL